MGPAACGFKDQKEVSTMRLPLLAASVALAASACTLTPVLVPDVGAVRVSGTQSAAVVMTQGVRVTVDGNAWQSDPIDLGDALTPVLVTIENNSRVPVRISYQDFSLVGSTGFHYAALPPFQVQGQMPVGERAAPLGIRLVDTAAAPPPAGHGGAPMGAPAPMERSPLPEEHGPMGPPNVMPPAPERPRPPPVVAAPQFHANRFFIAPRFAPIYPGIATWPYFYPYDGSYYDRFYGSWPVALPTTDMVNQALPEGVIESQGSISGFLYFQKVSSREQRVRFLMRLVDANGQRPFGDAVVPLVVSD
jgi:hypothetical protein